MTRAQLREKATVCASWALALIPLGMACGQVPKNIFLGIALVAGLPALVSARGISCLKTAPAASLALFLISSAFSLINTVALQDSGRGMFKLFEYLLVMAVICACVRTEKDLRRVVAVSALALALVSVDAAVQFATGRDFIRGYAVIENIGLVRVTASFVDSNVFGIFLSALGPLVLGMARYTAKGRARLIYGATGVLLIIASALTYSRPTILALFVSACIIAAAKRDRLAVSLLLALVVVAPFIAPASVREWARSVEYDPLRFMCNDDRIAVYRNSLNMIRDHPFVGVGTNTFMKRYKEYKENPEYRGVVTADYMYAHNNILHMAAETGLFGLAAFIWFLWALFSSGIRTYLKAAPGFLKDISLFLIACLAGFLVNGLTESSLYYSRVALVFWYLAGMLMCAGRAGV